VRTFETVGQTELADRPGSFAPELREALREAGLAGADVVVGVEPTLPRIAGDELGAVCPRALLRDATEAIESARRLKTAREVELLRRAVSVADTGQQRLVELAERLRPGRPCSDVWKAVRDTLGRFGIPIAHCAGHEIGVAVNERPRCLPYDATPIEPDMVFAVEAGAYAGPGGAVGARSERMALVTAGGPEILSAFSWGA
jgi:Xaa-Pro aminopeptidase